MQAGRQRLEQKLVPFFIELASPITSLAKVTGSLAQPVPMWRGIIHDNMDGATKLLTVGC